MQNIIDKRNTTYNLRNENHVIVPHLETYSMRNSVACRGAVIWNLLSPPNNAANVKAYKIIVWKSHWP
jgi:hypothetical protein